MQHEVKFTALDVKVISEAGSFEGYASLFNREDMGHDVILPGAFRDSILKRGFGGIKMLFQHDPSQPIGVWQTIVEDARGLFVRGQLANNVAKAQEVLALLRSGALDGLSIGFKALSGQRDRRTGIRRLAKVDLWEISVVTFPMQPDARVTNVKAELFARHDPMVPEFGTAHVTTTEKRLAAMIRRAASSIQQSIR